MSDLLKELNGLLEDSKEVELPTGGDFEDLPDGTYEAVIENCEFKESKSSGNLMFEWHFIIENGQYAGRHHWKYQVLTSAENMKRLTTDLAKFRVDTTSMDAIERGIDEVLIGAPCDITVKTSVAKDGKYKGQSFTNTSIKAVD